RHPATVLFLEQGAVVPSRCGFLPGPAIEAVERSRADVQPRAPLLLEQSPARAIRRLTRLLRALACYGKLAVGAQVVRGRLPALVCLRLRIQGDGSLLVDRLDRLAVAVVEHVIESGQRRIEEVIALHHAGAAGPGAAGLIVAVIDTAACKR